MGNFLSVGSNVVGSKSEGFADRPKLTWQLLTMPEAREALEEAEARDEYHEMINESGYNSKARGGLVNWSPLPPLREWSDLLSEITYPKWCNGHDIRIIASPSHAEGGMPHTRPTNLICIPVNYDQTKVTFERMIVHEIVHILQRMYYDKWMTFMRSAWLYRLPTPREYTKIPHKLLKRRRMNPDTLMCPVLVWADNWVPIIVFNEHIDGPRLKSTRIVWWNLSAGKEDEYPPQHWLDMFGQSPQAEHPFEIAAWYLSDEFNTPAAKAIKDVLPSILTRK
jgi:hypothetical protein